MKYLFLLLIAFVLLFSSCEKDITVSDNKQEKCNETYTPVLMLHGFLAASDTYNNFYQLFHSNGYCDDLLFVMDRNTLDLTGNFVPTLDSVVNYILTITQQSQINLMGHSAGGGLAYAYLNDSISHGKVAHYVHLASFPQSQAVKNVATLNIWSKQDLIVKGANIDGAENLVLEDADHYEVATSAISFTKVFDFFNGEDAPKYHTIQQQDEISIAGKVLTLGENVPLENATVEVYPIREETGERLNQQALFTLTTGKDGKWQPIDIKPNQAYEFFVSNPNDAEDRPMHYYREPFTRSTPLVYLRTIPPKGSLARSFLGELPNDNEQAVTVIFAASQAIISGIDYLTINGIELSIPEFTSAQQSTIALFLYDDGDQNSSFTLHQNLLANQPFLNAIDLFVNPTEQQTSTLTFNEVTLNIPNWKSASQGISVVVFD